MGLTIPNPAPADSSAEDSEAFFAAVYRRILRNMVILAVIVMPALWWKYDRRIALGFIAGCAIAVLNFQWLKRTVVAIGERVVNTGRKPSSAGVVIRFLLRYVLIAVGAYGIFRSSADSVYGLFGGLFLPVGAIFIEAVYAMYGALRHRF
jgi:hypothetical protein